MNLKNQMIYEEYLKEKSNYKKLGDIVAEKLNEAIVGANIMSFAVAQRVKAGDSLAKKLELKDGKYHQLSDITDILGVRIICYFSDDVDRISEMIENMFCVDRENSIDKRKALSPTAFGYLSVHYICSLYDDSNYPEEVLGKKFEIQIRSTLQHVWAEIEHDLGYKSEFGIPKNIRREFSRVAGLLEIADEHFANLRTSIKAYGDEIRQKITEDKASDVSIDMMSLKEYVLLNVPMRGFLNEIAKICNADISEISPESYLVQLAWLGKENLGDISIMLQENRELALKFARLALENSDLDILSSNIGLRYLCHAELINKGYSEDKIFEFMKLTSIDSARAERQTKTLMKNYNKICNM